MLVGLVAVFAVAVPAVALGAPPKPPVLKEDFTLLPCPKKPQTTLEIVGCAEHAIVKSDKAINAVVKVVYRLLPSDRARTRFVVAERAWLVYRKTTCESRSDEFEGGTLAGVVAASCVADLNDVHLKDLKAFEKALRH